MSASQEYYTPQWVLDLAVQCMGKIDLDPCSNPQRTVPARIHYVLSESRDGLPRPWGERLFSIGSSTETDHWADPFTVFVNPPWGNLDVWTEKLMSEWRAGHFSEALLLVPVRVERPWFQQLDCPVWFPDCRINYVQPQADGSLKQTKGIAHASCIFYLGSNPDRFAEVFGPRGRIYVAREAK